MSNISNLIYNAFNRQNFLYRGRFGSIFKPPFLEIGEIDLDQIFYTYSTRRPLSETFYYVKIGNHGNEIFDGEEKTLRSIISFPWQPILTRKIFSDRPRRVLHRF